MWREIGASGKTAGMAQQVMDSDRRVFGLDLKPGQILADRRVQVQQPLFVQLQHGDRGERLGD
ncbi:hypothetical protein D3C83_289060 [compost metagenome]